MITVAVHSKLRPYEIPRDIYIESNPFTTDNGLMTHSNKARSDLYLPSYLMKFNFRYSRTYRIYRFVGLLWRDITKALLTIWLPITCEMNKRRRKRAFSSIMPRGIRTTKRRMAKTIKSGRAIHLRILLPKYWE